MGKTNERREKGVHITAQTEEIANLRWGLGYRSINAS